VAARIGVEEMGATMMASRVPPESPHRDKQMMQGLFPFT
jgi:hypothetical protein